MFRNPGINYRAKHGQRNATVSKNAIVEFSYVELIPQCYLGLSAQALDLEAAQEVRGRLARDGCVAVNLSRD